MLVMVGGAAWVLAQVFSDWAGKRGGQLADGTCSQIELDDSGDKT
jgi:hypothetical protein